MAHLLVVDDSGDELWRIDPSSPGTATTPPNPYGNLGDLPSGLTAPHAMAWHDGALYVVDSGSDELWRIDPSAPDSTTSPYGNLGTLPSGLTSSQGMTSHDGALLIVDDSGDELWRIDPADPDDTSGDFGEVGGPGNGSLPSGLTQPVSMTSHDGALYVVDSDGEQLWRIDPSNPGSTTSPYGHQGTLPSGLTAGHSMTSHDGALYVADNSGDELWRINPSDPDSTASPYGNLGTLPSGLTEPRGMTSYRLPPVKIAADIASGTPEIAGDLSVTAPPGASLAADVAAGTPAIAGNVRVAQPLTLAEFDGVGLEIDMLALIEAGTAPDVFSRPPRGTNGTLLDPDNSDLEIDSSGEPINNIRFRDQGGGAGGERISLHDNGNLHLRDYFDTGGLGNDLTLWIQTADTTISFAVAGQVNAGGSNFIIFNVPAAYQAVVAGIASGDRFIIALTRSASAAVIELAADIAAGTPAVAGNLAVTAPPGASLAADVAAGTPAIAGNVRVAQPLTLAEFDGVGLEIDMLALIEAGTAPDVFSRPPRGTNGTLLDPDNSDLEIDSSGEPINNIRFRDQGGGAGGERISLHDNGNLHLRDYFDTGGLGNDLTLWIQTADTTISFAVAGQVNAGGSNFIIFNVPAAYQAVVAGIASGDRFIIALTRSASAAVIELAADIAAGTPAVAGNLAVTAPPGASLAADVAAGTPAIAASLSVTAPGVIGLAADIAAGTPSIAGDLSVTSVAAVQLAVDVAAGTPTLTANLSVTDAGAIRLAADIAAGTPAVAANLSVSGGQVRLVADIQAGTPDIFVRQLRVQSPSGIIELAIDRNSDGSFTDTDEDITSDVLLPVGIRCYRGNDVSVSLTPPRVGDLQAELRNDDDEYSPGSTVQAGRPVRLRIDGENVWRGYLERPTQHPEYSRQSVSISALGVMRRLRGISVTTGLYRGIRTDEAIDHVLDAAGWPAADRQIDRNTGTVLEWFWADADDAWSLLQMLFYSEGPGAILAEGPGGEIIFRGRRYLINDVRATTTQATFAAGGSPPVTGRFVYDDGEEHVINSASAVSIRRSAKAVEPIWEFGEQVNLGIGEVRTIAARALGAGPFMNAVVPVVGTDYTVLSGGLASAALSRTSGQSTDLTLTAGTQGVQLTGLQIRAAPVTVDSETLVMDGRNETASIDLYGRRTLPDSYALSPDIQINVLQSLVDAIVSWHATGQPQVAVPTFNLDGMARDAQVNLQLGDRVSVDAQAGNIQISGLFNVSGIEQRIKTTEYLETVFYGNESIDVPYAVWDTGQWGTGQWGF